MWHHGLLNYGVVGHLMRTYWVNELYKIFWLLCVCFNDLMRIQQLLDSFLKVSQPIFTRTRPRTFESLIRLYCCCFFLMTPKVMTSLTNSSKINNSIKQRAFLERWAHIAKWPCIEKDNNKNTNNFHLLYAKYRIRCFMYIMPFSFQSKSMVW